MCPGVSSAMDAGLHPCGRVSKRGLPRAGRALLAMACLSLTMLAFPISLSAAPLPDYAAVEKELTLLWKEKFPVSPLGVKAEPQTRALRTYVKGRAVLYYRFTLQLPRPDLKGEELTTPPGRTIEVWVRFRSWQKKPFDLTFVREDLLPGRGRSWIKLKR